jgi:hypothetical protein
MRRPSTLKASIPPVERNDLSIQDDLACGVSEALRNLFTTKPKDLPVRRGHSPAELLRPEEAPTD